MSVKKSNAEIVADEETLRLAKQIAARRAAEWQNKDANINLCDDDDDEFDDEKQAKRQAETPDRGARPRESAAYMECVRIGEQPEEQERLKRELRNYTTRYRNGGANETSS